MDQSKIICNINELLSKNNEITEKYEIMFWDTCSSIYLGYKINKKDGYVITTVPYLTDEKITLKVIIIPVDECKNPNSFYTQYFETDDIESITRLLLSVDIEY